jgi:SRSO17 transposase
MGLAGAKDIELRFAGYVEGLVSVIGHADRAGPLRDYCTGLVMPCERKSVEPMAAITAPERTAAQHQSLLHFVGQGGWSDAEVLGKVREMVLPRLERYGPIEAWIIDDTSFPKQGRHSVGAAHQYCGQLGKQANCQVAVSLSLANHDGSLPVAYRLYLPKVWAEDRNRRGKAGVPEEITFKTKPEIALEQIRWACEVRLPGDMVLLDAGYGHDSKLRRGITELGKRYVAGIQPQTLVWAPRTRPGRCTEGGAPRCGQSGFGQGGRTSAARESLAHDRLAGRQQRMAVLAVCTCACERGIRPRTCREAGKGVAADRVARGRG